MNIPLKDRIEEDGLKHVAWILFIWFVVIAMIVSPIAMYLV